MRCKKVSVPTTATPLSTLLEKFPRHTGYVGLQAPEANAQAVFVGDKTEQPIELRPGHSGNLGTVSWQEVYVLGTSGDFLTVVLFDG